MDEEEIIEILKDFIENENTAYCYDWNGFDHKTILPTIQKLLDLYQQEKEKNKKLKNQAKMSAEEHDRLFDKLEKMIDLLIEDLQMEGCLVDMTQAEIYRYYEKRILLEEE